MTEREIIEALTAAGIPNPKSRYDDNGGRYRVTAETEINGRYESHSVLMYLYASPEDLKTTTENFRLWINDLSENHRPD